MTSTFRYVHVLTRDAFLFKRGATENKLETEYELVAVKCMTCTKQDGLAPQ